MAYVYHNFGRIHDVYYVSLLLLCTLSLHRYSFKFTHSVTKKTLFFIFSKKHTIIVKAFFLDFLSNICYTIFERCKTNNYYLGKQQKLTCFTSILLNLFKILKEKQPLHLFFTENCATFLTLLKIIFVLYNLRICIVQHAFNTLNFLQPL